jgi:uncharacterized protein YbbK (DUF523 family)
MGLAANTSLLFKKSPTCGFKIINVHTMAENAKNSVSVNPEIQNVLAGMSQNPPRNIT